MREDAQVKQDRLRLLSVEIVTREAHTDSFFQGQPDPGHKERELELRSHRKTVQRDVYDMEHAIVTKISKPLIQEAVRSRIKQVSATDYPNRPAPEDSNFLNDYIAYREER